MADRGEYQPINGTRTGAQSSPLVTALLVVIAILSLVIIALSVIVYQNTQTLRNEVKKVVPPAPFTNLDFTKDDLTNYYTTQHMTVVAGLVAQWTTYMHNFLRGKDPQASKMAVVFDIDETSLNNYPYYAPSDISPQGVDYGYVPAGWAAWVNSSAAEAIAPVQTFYTTLQSLGVETIFITGRRDVQQPVTETNLANQGYNNYTALITRSPQWYNATAQAYKSYYRQQLVTVQGYDIIGCIGDQISDCNNGYAGYIMKIPNYIYYIE